MAESVGQMPFGKHTRRDIEDIPSNYFKWLLGEDWFQDQYTELYEAIEIEMNYRDNWNKHIYEE